MKKSLPLIAGAIVVPLLTAALGTLAIASQEAPKSTATLPASTSTSASTTVPEAPVVLATPPQDATVQQDVPVQAPDLAAADDPETPTTSQTTETTDPSPPVRTEPNLWPTPQPTTPPATSPNTPAAPIEMTVAWDGLKCARSEAWTIDSRLGTQWMCPGSATP